MSGQLALAFEARRRPRVDHLKPQAQALAAWLVEHGSVTSEEARAIPVKPMITRLSGRILELRQAGWMITTETERHEGGTHARYVLR